MREIVVLCDACQEDSKQKASPVTVAIDSARSYNLDLCEEHQRQLIKPLQTLIVTVGVPSERLQDQTPPKLNPHQTGQPAPKRGAGDFQGLLECPVGDYSAKHVSSIVRHLQNAHGAGPGQTPPSEWLLGLVCPLCNTEHQPLHAHHNSKHLSDIRGGLPGLFDKAKELGDPHGVIAAQKARLIKQVQDA